MRPRGAHPMNEAPPATIRRAARLLAPLTFACLAAACSAQPPEPTGESDDAFSKLDFPRRISKQLLLCPNVNPGIPQPIDVPDGDPEIAIAANLGCSRPRL